jgi:hypothetical protein
MQPTAGDQTLREYTIPEGCPACGADLPVRVTSAGPRAVCRACAWFGRPTITVTYHGWRVNAGAPSA